MRRSNNSRALVRSFGSATAAEPRNDRRVPTGSPVVGAGNPVEVSAQQERHKSATVPGTVRVRAERRGSIFLPVVVVRRQRLQR